MTRPLLLTTYLALTRSAPAILRIYASRAHRKMGAAPERLTERLGKPVTPRPAGRLVWFNAASVGELVSILDLIAALQDHGEQVLVTTTTATAADLAARRLPAGAIHQYQPVDTAEAVRGFLDHWQPDLACFVESDLWPRMVLECRRRGIRRALINARPSRTRMKMPELARTLLQGFSMISAQDGVAAAQIDSLLLGIPVQPVGDLKADANPLPYDESEFSRLKAQIGKRPVWIAASTHIEDEANVINAHFRIRQQRPDALLIHIPRHPDRGDDIAKDWGEVRLAQRSRKEPITPETQVYLADTLGEMGLFLRLSQIVFLGGSFGHAGGHNPHEPARLGCVVLHGPFVRHQERAYAHMDLQGDAVEVLNGIDLADQVLRLMSAPVKTGGAQGSGVTGQTVKALLAILP